MMLPITVIAGGLATRLGTITKEIPKSLIIVNNIPFVLHQLKLFQKNGINHVHFCLGHFGKMVENVIEESSFSKTMKITYSYDGEKLLGTGGAVKKALSQLPDTFFITYGDSFLDIDYKSIYSLYFDSTTDNCGLMTVYKNSNRFDTSNVIFEKNKIVLYSKNQMNKKMDYIDYGLGILRKNHFDDFPDNTPFDLSEIFEKLSINNKLIGYETFIRFYEIGSLMGLKDLSKYLKSKNT
jgi:N-acetyl-alpha-D-muramate 1-phosphate uridylyltransferase